MQSNMQLISAFVFTTQIVQYLFILNQNLQASKSELASLLPSPVALQLGLCPTWLETRTRFDVYETLCPQQMLVHNGGQMKDWGGECRNATPTKLQCHNI